MFNMRLFFLFHFHMFVSLLYFLLCSFSCSVMVLCLLFVPLPFIIFYEELINNQQKQTEKLLNACNLEWDENCMKFYKNKHFMSTGSNSINIHQPIYKTSMQSWKRYEKQLQPLIEVLKT